MFESVIFDIDGTLWDVREASAASYNRLLAEEGYGHLTVTAEQLLQLFGKTIPEISDILFAEIPAPRRYQLFEACSARAMKDYATDPSLKEYPGVRETMETLAKNHRLFIVSNSEKGYPELTARRLGISHLISGHLCYGDTYQSKGTTIRMLMERYGIENAVYVGDTQGDYLATREAGIPFIWCSYGFGKPDDCYGEIRQFSQLTEIL